ncbi:MAG: hypothetical protein A2172_05225 [Candidatus Woykebacteria bacterium RBG_13_40_15]|uniref:Carbohydrate-binding module family 96 domain-containing protein n=1 Tax=Candidatus Woykebacteria bacterium RBG_13_40_15 TaxID=1802593 RepID=A0A1G1W638_9BACT|nr:MAG: hypothetical protein A2172_05225 [Candidatus Woykebacteria bacterium RBG_13_40_15]
MKRLPLVFVFTIFFISLLFLIPKDNRVFAASTIELPSTGDTLIDTWFPSSNFGTLDYTQASKMSTTKQRILIKFNIDSIPTNASITSAALYMYMRDCSGSEESNSLHIDRVTSSWSEKTATWDNSKNIFASWYSVSAPCSSMHSYLKFDATSLVKAWFNGTYSNWGFYIWGKETAVESWGKRFFSKEDTSNKPKLVVVYNVPAQGPSTGGTDQTTSPETSADQGTDVTTTDQGAGSGKQTATSAVKKDTSNAEKNGISWVRVALLAGLSALLIGIIAGYGVYRYRKSKSYKKEDKKETPIQNPSP